MHALRAFRSLLLIAVLAPVSQLHAGEALADRLAEVLAEPRYRHAHWGILIADLATGDTLFEQNADKLFVPASTTKLFSVAAALNALGADYRFQTPIYATAEVDAQGLLAGNLVLVASGDLSLGGRTDAAGHITFTNQDHIYAGFNSTAELTDPDPLAGLDDLAGQVAAAGVKRVRGDMLIDDRLFDHAEGTGSGPSLITPMLVNDNLIDLVVTSTTPGAAAVVDWRPRTTAWQVDAVVETVAAGEASAVEVASPGEGRIIVRGRIAADSQPLVRIHPVADPARFARGLLIEALRRRGIAIDASPLDANRADVLPPRDAYTGLVEVARHSSPSFAESCRLILKVSHNLHASTLPLLVAARHGERTLAEGLRRQRDFLTSAGVEADSISFGGGAGGDRADHVTPRAAVALLRHMAGRSDFEAWLAALPVLGVDGTLAKAVAADSPARAAAQAKTGTLLWEDLMNSNFLLTSKALAGYLTTASGRRLAFSLYVNNVHLAATTDSRAIGQDLGRLCEIIHADE